MNTNEEIIDCLSYVRRILVKKGLLIFDFWYGPGVIALGPERRWKEFDLGEQSLLRLTSPQHDRDACVVTVTHKVVLSEKERIVSRFSAVHRMRYFFPNEIRLFLVHQGLELLKLSTWQDLDTPPQDKRLERARCRTCRGVTLRRCSGRPPSLCILSERNDQP